MRVAPGLRRLRRGVGTAAGAARVLVELGPATAVAVVANTVRLSADRRRERRVARRPAVARTPGRLESFEPLSERRTGSTGRLGRPVVVGVSCRFAEAELEVRFLADDFVRVSWGPDEPPLPWALSAAHGGVLGGVLGDVPGGVLGDVPGLEPPAGRDGAAPAGAAAPVLPDPARLGPPRGVKVSADDAGGCRVVTRALAVHVEADGSLRYTSADGAVVRHELPPLRRGSSRTHRHLLRPGERVAGLGEQAGGVDLAGSAHRLWNRDPGGGWGPGADPLYCVVPVLLGVHPGGDVLAFYENSHDGEVRVGATPAVGAARVEVRFAAGMLRHHLGVGPLPVLLERYAALTGRPPLPPRWALGYHQSRWGYRTDGEVRAVAAGFGDERIPLSAIYLDIDYMDGYRVFSVDTERFPDLGALAGNLGERGTRVVAIVDPAVKVDPAYDVYAQGTRDDRFVRRADGAPLTGVVWPGPAAFADFTDPVTRRWWSGHYGRLLDQGVAGVWHDMNEPTSIALWGDRTLPVSGRHVAEGVGADHRQCHNVYGLCMDAAGAAALADVHPERRPFVLSRSGWAGVQRFAWNWTGDSDSTWDALGQQVATVVGLGLSGIAFSGSDIGGFAGDPGAELYLRWLEMAVFMPLCRTHCVTSAPGREPWQFPEPYRSAVGRLIRFRYRLLPYLYTLAHDAATHGHPLVRPLWWAPHGGAGAAGTSEGGDAPGPWSDDCFLLGDDLLVAPVVAAGAHERRVPLPPGRWLRWRPLPAAGDGPVARLDRVVPVAGRPGVPVGLDAPLGSAPVLVRTGTVLTLDDGWAYPPGDVDGDVDVGRVAPGHEPRLVAFHCFPDDAGRAVGRAYDDAGDGYGPTRTDRLELTGPDGDRVLRWSVEGAWPVPERVRVVVHGVAASAAMADGSPVAVRVEGGGAGGGLVATVVDCGPFSSLELR
jgi:alpha-glucosidase